MKNNKILIVLMPVLLIILFAFGYLNVTNTKTDPIKFKNEYEKYNNEFYKITVNKDNNIKYSNYDEITKAIKSDTAIFYFGTSKDNDSRYAINNLLNLLENKKMDTVVYYLDISNDRYSYVVENDKVVYELDKNGNEIKGSNDYIKLVSVLDEFLLPYKLEVNDKTYDTLKKQILIPTLVFVKSGSILGALNVTVDIPYDELHEIYESYLNVMYQSSCDLNSVVPC